MAVICMYEHSLELNTPPPLREGEEGKIKSVELCTIQYNTIIQFCNDRGGKEERGEKKKGI